MDFRYFASVKGKWYQGIDIEKNKVLIDPEKYYNYCQDDGEEEELLFRLTKDDGFIYLPFKYEVCGSCKGKGSYVNPSIDSHGITSEEWNEWSLEDIDNYFSGMYDVTCEECNGKRVVPEIDVDYLTEDEISLVKFINKVKQDDYDYARESYYERQMGY